MDYLLIAQSSFSWFDAESWWAIFQVALGLGLVIFVHELGHFLVAKACGVKCEKFYVGFDAFDLKFGDIVILPRALAKFQWGETEYGIGIVPLGGYVKMLGQDDNPSNMEKEIERSKIESTKPEEQPIGDLDRDQMDPRSFLAKSVPQRMAIISAGVIFNLISAVLFAAIAFKSGVLYNPPVIGRVTPGGPGWKANLHGAEVKKIGETKVEGYFPFMDLAQKGALSGSTDPIPFEIERVGNDQIETLTAAPERGLIPGIDLPMFGIEAASIPKVTSGDNICISGHAASKAEPPFAANDLIVGINDQKVENVFDLQRILAKNFDQPLKFLVQRGEEKEEIAIAVEANPLNSSGLIMEWGTITAIQNDSPASDSDLQPGDQIIQVDQLPPGDLFTFEQRMTRVAINNEANPGDQKTVELTIRRDGEERQVRITPRVPNYFSHLAPGSPIAVNSLGIAIESTNLVASSNIADVKPGYEVTHFEIDLSDSKTKDAFEKRFNSEKAAQIDLTDENINWVSAQNMVQLLPAGAKFTIKGQKSQQVESEFTANSTTQSLSDSYLATRGVLLSTLQETYISPTWSDAFTFGALQTYKEAGRVFKFLGKLVSGKISPKNLGGPGTIAVVATSEASQGTSRLLLFLVLLSANLAVVNFMPIPVLDGGHMVFLAYEGIFRQPPSEKVQVVLTYAGLFMILGLMSYVILLDIQRISSWWWF